MVTPEELYGRRYEGGEVIFRQGDPGDTMYVIQSGEVEVTRFLGEKEVVLARLGGGEFFGEMALIENVPRSATVRAVLSTRVFPLSKESLFGRAEQDPQVVLQILAALSRRISKTASVVESLLQRDPELRESWKASAKDLPAQERPPAGETGFLLDVDSVSSVRVDRGEIVFRQGAAGDAMYFIIDGEIEISYEFEGESTRLAVLGAHEFFGEMALITGSPRTATATALTPSVLLPVKREEFVAKIRSKPQLGLFIVQVLISRLRGWTTVHHR